MRTVRGPGGMRTTRWYSTNDSHPARLIDNLDEVPVCSVIEKLLYTFLYAVIFFQFRGIPISSKSFASDIC